MISKYYKRGDIECKCGCGGDTIDVETMRIADEICDLLGYKATISSGFRCYAHNRAIFSKNTSQHIKGRAIDMILPDPKRVYDWLCRIYPDQYGFGLYKNFIHFDTKTGPKRRW